MPGVLGSVADVVIVGGGMAGLEVAGVLAEIGLNDVLVLESGPEGDTRHTNIALSGTDALRRWLAPETDPYFERRWISRTPPHYTGPSGLRRRLGGRSLYWYGVCLPIDEWARDAWPDSVIADLTDSWQGGPSLYNRTRAMLRHWSGRDDDAPSRPDLNLGGLTFAPTPLAVRADGDRWRAYSPLDRWRDPDAGGALALPSGVRILTGADVQDVLVDVDGRARGVRVTVGGHQTEVRANSVVLAAGTLENSRLALQAVLSAGAGDTTIGGLNDHIVQGFFLRVDTSALSAVQGQLPQGGRYSLGDGTSRSNVFLDVSPGDGGTGLVDVRATGEQLPDGACRITLEEAQHGPRLAVFATPSARDQELIAAQRRTLSAVWADIAGLLGLPETPLEFGNFDSPERVNAFVLPETIDSAPSGVPLTWSSYLGVEDHEAGTLPLGSFIDLDHEVRQVPRLFVAGPSSFSRMGAANPSLTTLALARRLAGVLARQRGTDARVEVATADTGA